MTDIKEIKKICEDFCAPYHPDVSEITSSLDYKQCLSDCEDLYDILKEFVDVVIIRKCREDVSWRPEKVREKVFKGCVDYYINTLIAWRDLVEKFLKMITVKI